MHQHLDVLKDRVLARHVDRYRSPYDKRNGPGLVEPSMDAIRCARWFFGATFLAMLFVCASAGRASAAETYVCVGEQSTGFKWSGSEWQRAGFLPDKFVVSKTETQSEYIVTQPGSDRIVHRCNAEAGSRQMFCGGPAYNFAFNFESLRFQEYHGTGYIQGDAFGSTPYIMIGRCTKL